MKYLQRKFDKKFHLNFNFNREKIKMFKQKENNNKKSRYQQKFFP